MKAQQYPTVSHLSNQLINALQSQYDPTDYQLQLKYSKLVSGRTGQYENLLQQSKKQIVILNSMYNFKQYRINAMSTRDEFQVVNANAAKMKNFGKSQCVVKMDLKFGREGIGRVRGCDQWVYTNKEQGFKKQYNVLVNGKQFRVDLSRKQIISNNAQLLLKKHGQNLTNQIKFLRFKQTTVHKISKYFKITTSWIHESQSNSLKQQISKIIQTEDPTKMDELIYSQIPRNNKKQSKYEIELVLTQEGIEKLMGIVQKGGDCGDVNRFLGALLVGFQGIGGIGWKGDFQL